MCAALSCQVDLVAADPNVFGLRSKFGWNEYGAEPGYQWLKSLSIQALDQLPSDCYNGGTHCMCSIDVLDGATVASPSETFLHRVDMMLNHIMVSAIL